jgi:hypothetical protein
MPHNHDVFDFEYFNGMCNTLSILKSVKYEVGYAMHENMAVRCP